MTLAMRYEKTRRHDTPPVERGAHPHSPPALGLGWGKGDSCCAIPTSSSRACVFVLRRREETGGRIDARNRCSIGGHCWLELRTCETDDEVHHGDPHSRLDRRVFDAGLLPDEFVVERAIRSIPSFLVDRGGCGRGDDLPACRLPGC